MRDDDDTAMNARQLAEELEGAGVPFESLETVAVGWASALEKLEPGPVPADVLAGIDLQLAAEAARAPLLADHLAALRRHIADAADLERAVNFLVETRTAWESLRWQRAQRAPWDRFPIGCQVAAGTYRLDGLLRGEPPRGMYRAVGPGGARHLVTLGTTQQRPLAELVMALDYEGPNIAHLHHIGPLDGHEGDFHAMVEDEPAGRPSSDLPLPLPAATAVRLALETAAALERVHEVAGPVRFLRPELIYLVPGADSMRVSAIAPRAELFLSTASRCYGVPPLFDRIYAAPEVLGLDDDITPAADVFSLAAALGLWLTGEHPFAGDTPSEQMEAIFTGRGRAWRGPMALGIAVGAALERDPAARPSLGQFAADLERAARQP